MKVVHLNYNEDQNTHFLAFEHLLIIFKDRAHHRPCCCPSAAPLARSLSVLLSQTLSHGNEELVKRHMNLRSIVVGEHHGHNHMDVVG